MSIDLPGNVEAQLRSLAERQGREVGVLVEEAIRQYLEAVAITDLGAYDVAETQAALVSELPPVPEWKNGNA